MIRLKVSLGALLACAAAFAVLGSGTAAASTVHECKETGGTAKLTAQRYSDSACTTKSETGKFQTVPVEGTQKVKATQTSNFVLKSAPLGIQNEITCEELSSSGATVTNVEEGGVMKVKGGAQKTIFSKCQVNKPAGCTVKQPIETKEVTSITEDLAGEVMRTKFTPVVGKEFVTITLEGCGLLNGNHTIEGVARSQSEGTTTQAFSTTSGSELTFFGATATLEGKYHVATESGGQLLALETP
jgi:hypothetical protein